MKSSKYSTLNNAVIATSLIACTFITLYQVTFREAPPLPQRVRRVLAASSDEFSQEKIMLRRKSLSDSYSIRPIRRDSTKINISIIIVVTEGTPLENYATALNSVECYTKLHSYPLHLIYDSKYGACAKHKDKFFRRHCAIVHFLESEMKEGSLLLMLDADIAVINPNILIEKYIDPDYDITLFDRFFNYEVVAGSYLVRNRPMGRTFVQKFADYEFRLPNSRHGSDNGMLHPLLAEFLVPDNGRMLDSLCAKVLRESKNSSDLYEMEACNRLIFGDRTHFAEHKLRILSKGKAWMRDIWLLKSRWADDDFMLHAIKEEMLHNRRPDSWTISDSHLFQWKPLQREKVKRYFPLLRRLNVTKCELGEERWVYDSRLKITNEKKAKLLDYMESKILKRRLEAIGNLSRRL